MSSEETKDVATMVLDAVQEGAVVHEAARKFPGVRLPEDLVELGQAAPLPDLDEPLSADDVREDAGDADKPTPASEPLAAHPEEDAAVTEPNGGETEPLAGDGEGGAV